ncbi:MAG: hypothetical protein ACOY4P_07430 [Pseudomonadota bacterium]
MSDAPPATRAAGFAPCPTCGQYSHSIGDDQLAAALMHFEAMTDHRGDGIPTQRVFDDATRDAAQVLMAAAVSEGAPLLRFADAEQIGVDLHDRWEKMTGQAPIARDDMGWADVVQFVVRRAREIVTERETSNG